LLPLRLLPSGSCHACWCSFLILHHLLLLVMTWLSPLLCLAAAAAAAATAAVFWNMQAAHELQKSGAQQFALDDMDFGRRWVQA
jgi:hypothetical protein